MHLQSQRKSAVSRKCRSRYRWRGMPGALLCADGTDGQPAAFLKAKPKTDHDRCSGCGDCARVCPMGAVSREEPEEITGICIKCQACVRVCGRGAKYFDDAAFLSHVAMLEQNFARRAENRIFL